jgi:molecular chaperone DnaK
MRATIDFGIYLGIHNSAIAVLEGNHAKIIKNNDGMDFTPCVVHIDKKGTLHVGKMAKSRLEMEPEDAYTEFKLQMGTETVYTFKRSGRQMRPEELTAEVLKSLRSDVQQRLGEDIQAAVIAVPAAYELVQCKSIERAAQLAGFEISPLILEPTAAAMPHAFQSKSNRVFWLVYDLSGGTFDAAVVQLQDGNIRIVNHAGDNHLGGKLIDWDIVENLLVPAVKRIAPLTDFSRINPKWRSAFAKLKWAAEEAKIRLSHDPKYSIVIDFLCLDDRGEPVSFDFEITHADLTRIAAPYIQRSVNISRKALTEARLGPADIEKAILVGGPTLAPYVREQLADPREGLGIELDTTYDPLTVVAQGAAIFASTQRIGSSPPPPPPPGIKHYNLELEYNPTGADQEPRIGGKIVSTYNENFTGFSIEFIDNSGKYRSGKIPVSPTGAFKATLLARPGIQNTYFIELTDASGDIVQCTPNEVKYTVQFHHDPSIVIHSIGLAMPGNEVAWLITKGTPLPARQRQVLRTEVVIRSGRMDAISLPILEGKNSRADRNRTIGFITIRGHHLRHDLPAGSEIEITIEMDASRLVTTSVYIPQLDQEFESVVEVQKQKPNLVLLRQTVEFEKKRLQNLREAASKTNDPTALHLLNQQVDDKNLIQNIESALAAATGDPDAADKAQDCLLELQIALDKVEQALQIVQAGNKPTPPVAPVITQPVQPINLQVDHLRQALPVEVNEAIHLAEVNLPGTKVKQVQSVGKQLTNACQSPSVPELIQAITSFDQGITSSFGEEMNFLIWRSESLKRRVELLDIQTNELTELFRQLNRQMFNADLQSVSNSINKISQLILKYLQEGTRKN